MPAKSIELPRFGGLTLLADPQEAGLGAIDLLNAALDRDGRVRSRDGYAKFTAAAATNRILDVFPFYTSSGSAYLLAATDKALGGEVIAYNTSGGVVATAPTVANPATPTSYSFARIGTTSTETVYVSISSGVGRGLAKFDGSTWTVMMGSANAGRFLAVQSPDNRLVVGGNDASNASRVKFSDSSAAETFGTNNWVDLMPGDGENISNLVSFDHNVIAFKQTKFFVFYGNSVGSTGTPIFNYRAVDTGVGCVSPRGAVSTPRGVFFVDRRGIYLTTGGAPELISRAIDPLFVGGLSAYVQTSTVNQAAIDKTALAWHNERLYFAFPSGSATVNDRLAVFDPKTGDWLLHDIAAGAMCTFRVSAGIPDLTFAYPSGTKDIGRHAITYTDDAGVAIASRYRTGFWNPGQAGTEAWVRETLLDGTGTVTVKTAVNDAATLRTGQAATLGTDPAVGQGRDRRGFRGRNVSYEFSGTAPWSLSRVTPIVWGQTGPGYKSS